MVIENQIQEIVRPSGIIKARSYNDDCRNQPHVIGVNKMQKNTSLKSRIVKRNMAQDPAQQKKHMPRSSRMQVFMDSKK